MDARSREQGRRPGQRRAERSRACWPIGSGRTSAAAGASPIPIWKSSVSSRRNMFRWMIWRRTTTHSPNAPPELRHRQAGNAQEALCRCFSSICAMAWQSRRTPSSRSNVESTSNAARQSLRDPWAIVRRSSRALLPRSSSTLRTGRGRPARRATAGARRAAQPPCPRAWTQPHLGHTSQVRDLSRDGCRSP